MEMKNLKVECLLLTIDSLEALITNVELLEEKYRALAELLGNDTHEDGSLPTYKLGQIKLGGTPLILELNVGSYRRGKKKKSISNRSL